MIWTLFLLFNFSLSQSLDQLTRTVDFKGSVVREKVAFTAAKPGPVFYIAVPIELDPHLADIAVTVDQIPTATKRDKQE